MSGPIDSIRNFVDTNIRPVVDDVVDAVKGLAQEHVTPVVDDAVEFVEENIIPVAEDVVEAGGVVGQSLADAASDVKEAVQEDGLLNVGFDLFKVDLTTKITILKELTQRSPVDFVNWLAGPDGPSFADYTAQIPGLQEAMGDVMDTAMSNPMIAGAIGKAFGFEYVPGLDFYTTNESSIQSYLGFHSAYDKVGKLMGMDLDDKVMEVEVGGVEYKLELWKGSYGNGGAFGGEIGFYTRGTGERGPLGDFLEKIPGYYSSAAGESQIQMTQTIYNKETGQVYFTNDGKGADGTDKEHFWNLAIRTDPGVEHEDLGQRGTLVMDDPEVASAICAEMNRQGALSNPPDLTASVADDGVTINYDWK